jgi:hypothetical protein
MKEELGLMNYRKLLYFFENKIPIHFNDLDYIFYNGLIIDLSEEKLTMVLQERIKGTIPILLENVIPHSIKKMDEKNDKH